MGPALGRDAELSLQHLDVSRLMWDMRRNLDPTPLPAQRSVVQFHYQDLLPAQRTWWLLVEPDVGVDLCSVDPGSMSTSTSRPICAR